MAAPQDVLTPEAHTPPQAAQRQARHAAQSLRAVMEVAAAGKLKSVVGEMCDLSKGGAKLLLASDVSLAEAITLRLLDDRQETMLSVSGKVCWSRPTRDGHWRVGCTFDYELPMNQLSELAVNGYVERRQHQRCPLDLNATAQWELESESFAAELEDVSRGGFCLFCTRAPRQGERLRVSLDGGSNGNLSLLALAKWHVKVNGGHLVGCEFLDHASGMRLQQLVRSLPAAKRGPDGASNGSALAGGRSSGDASAKQLVARAYRRLAVAIGLIVAGFVTVVCANSMGGVNGLLIVAISLSAVFAVWRLCAAINEASR